MPREPIIRGGDDEGKPPEGPSPRGPLSEDDDRQLRPRRLAEMVGQRDVARRLNIALNAARLRGDTLGHILFDGPPGLGKTTFATVIPQELGVSLQIASGATMMAPRDLMPYLTNVEESSVLFIDEIHRMSKAVEEFLYPAMEDFRIDITLGEGTNARTINMRLAPFTLIGATTRSGLLSGPLRDRFLIREHLDFYTDAELTEIVTRNAGKLDAEIEPAAAVEIARRSRGTPRIANNHLRWVRDYATSETEDWKVTREVALEALRQKKIDIKGLDEQDRRYLLTIVEVFHGGPVGVEAVAHTMNTAADTLVDDVEPFLLRAGLVVRTPRGRRLTPLGYEHLGLDPDEGARDGQGRLF